MSTNPGSDVGTPLTLLAKSAHDLMARDPLALSDDATIQQAITQLTDRGLNAAAVVNDARRLVGVLSHADILIHEREQTGRPSTSSPSGAEPTRVRDLMTPVIFSVSPETPALKVIQEMVAMKVHQLFVVDTAGSLVGVISTFDVLCRIQG